MIERAGQQRIRDAYQTRPEQASKVESSDTARAQRKPAAQPLATGDSVEISDEGMRVLQRAVETVKQAPDIRHERVAELRQKIEAGEYQVTSAQLAAKLVGEPDAPR